MKILGIETSCDETAAAIVADSNQLLSSVVASSMDQHAIYGGIVPEIAARSHIEFITPVINSALSEASTDWSAIDGIAVTYGAGLGGSLLVGVMAARTLSIIHHKPLFGINHVEAHLYANFITRSKDPSYSLPHSVPEFPLIGLIVSGGHSQLVYFEDHFKYRLLGQTHDDAIGEAFDKVARILGLAYPGGVSVERTAKSGDPTSYKLPKAKLENPYDLSFSGLKTAVLRLAQKEIGKPFDYPSREVAKELSQAAINNLAASFQRVAVETIVDRVERANNEFKPRSIIVGGGVAANGELRRQLSERISGNIYYPDLRLCTDNGAMVACLGSYKASLNQPPSDPYELDIQPSLTM